MMPFLCVCYWPYGQKKQEITASLVVELDWDVSYLEHQLRTVFGIESDMDIVFSTKKDYLHNTIQVDTVRELVNGMLFYDQH